jgi:tetratricopeptide (TPR) repeat protein
MKEQAEEQDTQLRRYLLGELSDEEQQKIEEKLLVDNGYVEQMLIAEEDLIDDYISGRLPLRQQQAYKKLFPLTREGRQKVQVTRVLKAHLAEFNEPHPSLLSRFQAALGPLFSPLVLKVAAALLIVGLGVLNWSLFFRQTDLKKGLVALTEAYREQRPIEARITGLPYAPFSGPNNSYKQTNTVKLNTVDNAFQKLAGKSSTPDSLHALGKYFLTEKKFDDAIRKLEEGLKAAPKDTTMHIDLAVALMERGKITLASSQTDFDNSQQHLIEALRLAPSSLEARFNLGLLHQSRKSWRDAEENWRQYLQADPNSQWAEEAKRFLSIIETQKN